MFLPYSPWRSIHALSKRYTVGGCRQTNQSWSPSVVSLAACSVIIGDPCFVFSYSRNSVDNPDEKFLMCENSGPFATFVKFLSKSEHICFHYHLLTRVMNSVHLNTDMQRAHRHLHWTQFVMKFIRKLNCSKTKHFNVWYFLLNYLLLNSENNGQTLVQIIVDIKCATAYLKIIALSSGSRYFR